VALLAPWVVVFFVWLGRPQLHHFGDTGLAVTKAEATWLAAWLLAVVVVAVSSIIRWCGGAQAGRDMAETAYTKATEATSLMTAQAVVLPPGDPRAGPAVSALLGAQQTALTKRDGARVGERRLGLRGLIVGTDGRASTSKVQAALWTGAVLYAFLFLLIAGWHIWNRPKTPRLIGLKDGFAHLIVHPLQPEYLVLLGVPITAAIAAKALTLNKVIAGTLAKTTGTSEGVAAGLAETVSNDTGNADLLDSQYVAFNLITLIYFFSAFFGTTVANPSGGLPSIPPTLLALSGVSAHLPQSDWRRILLQWHSDRPECSHRRRYPSGHRQLVGYPGHRQPPRNPGRCAHTRPPGRQPAASCHRRNRQRFRSIPDPGHLRSSGAIASQHSEGRRYEPNRSR
jgi:hypothetical protein